MLVTFSFLLLVVVQVHTHTHTYTRMHEYEDDDTMMIPFQIFQLNSVHSSPVQLTSVIPDPSTSLGGGW